MEEGRRRRVYVEISKQSEGREGRERQKRRGEERDGEGRTSESRSECKRNLEEREKRSRTIAIICRLQLAPLLGNRYLRIGLDVERL